MKINPLGKLTEAEKALVQAALPELKGSIDKVIKWNHVDFLECTF